MGYLYAGMWFIIAIVLIVRFRKESKAVYILSAYFAVMGGWWLANELVSVDLLNGTYGWILRGVSAVALVVAVLAYYREKKMKDKSQNSDE